jgi:hypothetical protein
MRFYCCVSFLIVEILCPFLSACLAHSKNKSTFKLRHKNLRLFNFRLWFGDRKMNRTCRIVGWVVWNKEIVHATPLRRSVATRSNWCVAEHVINCTVLMILIIWSRKSLPRIREGDIWAAIKESWWLDRAFLIYILTENNKRIQTTTLLWCLVKRSYMFRHANAIIKDLILSSQLLVCRCALQKE